MTDAKPYRSGRDPVYDYLCVDDFLGTAIDARALASALSLGLIDRLAAGPVREIDRLRKDLKIDAAALTLLLDLLGANQVVALDGTGVRLTGAFEKALRYRDLLEVRLEFAERISGDFLHGFTDLISDPERFVRRAALFRLFSYGRCFDPTQFFTFTTSTLSPPVC